MSTATLERDAAGAWTIATSQGQPPRYNHALAYDEARGVTVLFGGFLCDSTLCNPGSPGGPVVYGDTWEWSGSSWTERVVGAAPPARFMHAMTYDTSRGRVVMHSGRGASGSLLGDLWEWDGSVWTQRTTLGDTTSGSDGGPLGHPRGRENHSLAFDRTRNVLMLHGGLYFIAPPEHTGGDTWELAADP